MKWEGDTSWEALGLIPEMLYEDDPRTAREQLHANYGHGGGWRPFPHFKFDPDRWLLKYPGDPPIPRVAWTKLRDEQIILFRNAWVMILQPDGSFEIARMD